MLKKIFILLGILILTTSFVFAQGSMYQEPGSSVESGKTTVNVAGTAVPLASSETRVLSVSIAWLPDNGRNKVYVGDSTVTSSNGIQISSGSVLTLQVNDLSKVYINSDRVGDGVSWIAVLR